MKETFYFSHDYNASQDPKILNMLSIMKWEGYGLFWLVVEKLAEAGGKLKFSDLKGIAFSSQVDIQKIKSLILDFELFESNENFFWSNRLISHFEEREKISKVRRKAGRKGGVANAKQMLSKREAKGKQNQAKESKVKESKGNIYISFLQKFNEVTKRNFKVIDDKTKRQIKAREKEGFTIDDIIRATKNAYKDEYHKENNFKYLTPEFITRSDKLQRFLNQVDKKQEWDGSYY